MIEPESPDPRIATFESLCHAEGLPFTVQRRLILETVLGLEGHPTADQVHQAVARRAPAISRTTVYRTLETLVRMGLITKACHPGRQVRYDQRTEAHHHLVCLRCDEVIDLAHGKIPRLPIPDTSPLGFEVRDYRVQLRGLCRRCRTPEDSR